MASATLSSKGQITLTAAGVRDALDWPDNENRVHGKRYRKINERH